MKKPLSPEVMKMRRDIRRRKNRANKFLSSLAIFPANPELPLPERGEPLPQRKKDREKAKEWTPSEPLPVPPKSDLAPEPPRVPPPPAPVAVPPSVPPPPVSVTSLSTLPRLTPSEIKANAEGWFGLHVDDLRQSSEALRGTPADGTEEATEKLKQLKLREEVREKQVDTGLKLFGRGSVAREKPNITVDVTVYQEDGTISEAPIIEAEEVTVSAPEPMAEKPKETKIYDPFE